MLRCTSAGNDKGIVSSGVHLFECRVRLTVKL